MTIENFFLFILIFSRKFNEFLKLIYFGDFDENADHFYQRWALPINIDIPIAIGLIKNYQNIGLT
jgi:hypothetical protein